MGIRDLLAATQAPKAKKEWPALEIGRYQAHVLDATYQPNKDGDTKITTIKLKLDSGNQIGRWINTYLSPRVAPEQFVRSLRPWLDILATVGVSDTAIIPEDEDVHDITRNLEGAISKALRQGKLIKVVVVVAPNSKAPEKPFVNVYPVDEVEAAPAPVVTPTTAELAAFAAASAPVTEGF